MKKDLQKKKRKKKTNWNTPRAGASSAGALVSVVPGESCSLVFATSSGEEAVACETSTSVCELIILLEFLFGYVK